VQFWLMVGKEDGQWSLICFMGWLLTVKFCRNLSYTYICVCVYRYRRKPEKKLNNPSNLPLPLSYYYYDDYDYYNYYMYYIRMNFPSTALPPVPDYLNAVSRNRRMKEAPPLSGTKPKYSSTWYLHFSQGTGPSVALACAFTQMKMMRRNHFQKVSIIIVLRALFIL